MRTDDLARQLVIASGDAIGHKSMLNKLSHIDSLIFDGCLTAGTAANADSFPCITLADRDHRLPTVIVSQSGPACWVETFPERIASNPTVNRLANQSECINSGR